MALVQEMAVKIDQGFLEAILTVFTPAADPLADRQKVRLGPSQRKPQNTVLLI